MSAYRICSECGAALDPGERCDCRPAAPVKLILPGPTVTAPSARHRQLINMDFTGQMGGCTLTLAEEPQGRREGHAAAESDQNQPLQAGVRL